MIVCLSGISAIETLRGEDAEFGFGQVDYVGLEQARGGGRCGCWRFPLVGRGSV